MPEITAPINKLPNCGWRIIWNTATARIHQATIPTLVKMTLDATPEGALVLTMKLENLLEDGSKERTAKSEYRFTPGKGRASTITQLASAFSPHEAASMLKR